MASLDFCLVVLQVAWLFSSPTCSARVQLLAACKPRVPASLHSLEHFFTLSHTLPLHDSHLNIGFLSAVLQANLSWNKANTWLIKFNLTVGLSQLRNYWHRDYSWWYTSCCKCKHFLYGYWCGRSLWWRFWTGRYLFTVTGHYQSHFQSGSHVRWSFQYVL